MTLANPVTLGLVALLAPGAAATLLAVLAPARRTGWAAAAVTILSTLVALAAAGVLALEWLRDPAATHTGTVPWLAASGRTVAEVGVHLDGISVSMLLVVTFVALCVQVFSVGYMDHEPKPAFGRYFTYHALFLFSMNMLVLAPNLLELFVGWELVGVTSYLLIGFYFRKPSAARAATKAFWFTKLGDLGFAIALLVLYGQTGTFAWDQAMPVAVATAVTGLLFLAVVGKSAQFPLHVWLPDAMEGPTPVSALLHAATMVAAGVFLVVRANPLFAQAEATRMVMLHVGAFTALFAATIAVVQSDIKKVLAYSTCSQLGYMIAALGSGALLGGFFHLTTHAFFKALLFLAAGSVIHAVGSNNLDQMGGLRRRMPLTAVAFVVGALALAGIPGLSGFFSKDLILEAVSAHGSVAPLVALLGAAFLTAFYMGRVVFMAFFGKPASERSAHAHESGTSMALPLVLLAIPALGAGYLAGSFADLYRVEYHFHLGAVGVVASGLAIAGLLLAYLVYGAKVISPSVFTALSPVGALARSGAVDAFFRGVFRVVLVAGAAAAGWIDRYLIDPVMNVIGWSVVAGGRTLRRIQTGNVQDYVFAVAAGILLLAVWGVLP